MTKTSGAGAASAGSGVGGVALDHQVAAQRTKALGQGFPGLACHDHRAWPRAGTEALLVWRVTEDLLGDFGDDAVAGDGGDGGETHVGR